MYVEKDAINDDQGNSIGNLINLYVDIEKIVFTNLYAPVDVQVIPSEASINNDGGLTVLVSKLRSQSFTNGLGGEERATELINRSTNEANTDPNSEAIELNESFSEVETSSLIYETNYLDGHSVVQYNMEGDVIFSNNAAVFASSLESAKNHLGSAEKMGVSELLIGDSENKRAIIVNTELSTQTPTIIWQYDSDRYVSDFHLDDQEERVVSINDGSISEGVTYIREGMDLTWTNNSSSPISIYSGSTTYTLFNLNPNLNLYGSEFKSPTLQPGESYTFKFNEEGNFPWFVYPSILTGEIKVNKHRLSSQDNYIILESDGLDSPFSSRVIKVDSWGNTLWSFGEGYLVKPRDARPMLNNKVLIST